MSERPRRSFGTNVLISFGFTGLMTVLAFANSVVLARLTGAEGRGLYALAVAGLGIAVPILSAGLSFSATWAIGQGRNLAQVVSLDHLWSLMLLLLGGSLGGGISWWFGGLPTEPWAQVLFTCVLTAPAMVYGEIVRGALLGLDQVVRYNAVQVSGVLVLLIANLTLLHLGAWAVLLTLGLSYWVVAIVLLLGHVRHVRRLVIPEKTLVTDSVRYGVKAAGTSLVEILITRLDYLLVTPIVGVAAIGLFSVSDQIVAVLGWGGLVAGRMMLAESARDSQGDNARRKLGLGVRILLFVVGLAALGAAALGWWLIPVVFGAEFADSYIGLLILLPCAMLRGASALLSTYLIGRNVIRPALKAGAAAILVVLVFAPLSAHAFGWLGIAGVRVVAVLVQLVLNARAYREATGDHFRWVLNGEDVVALRNWVQVRLERRRGPPGSP